ncbi:uncharacterized protein LOC123895403 [Trifolium pratense]|uniref:uncharacterized protein LOC123895403 n=1 Tax=Trifolium pratense TaxID=57577 RepID=UPI001E692E88|nr:uncharacterized protein LOC123895403 [Trifolium pratense]
MRGMEDRNNSHMLKYGSSPNDFEGVFAHFDVPFVQAPSFPTLSINVMNLLNSDSTKLKVETNRIASIYNITNDDVAMCQFFFAIIDHEKKRTFVLRKDCLPDAVVGLFLEVLEEASLWNSSMHCNFCLGVGAYTCTRSIVRTFKFLPLFVICCSVLQVEKLDLITAAMDMHWPQKEDSAPEVREL